MNYFKLACRSLSRKGQSNYIKIICLAAGLSLGLILIAKARFIDEYNTCFADYERIYTIRENFRRDKEMDFEAFSNSSGGVAPGMAAAIPEIEVATRITPFIGQNDIVLTLEGEELEAKTQCADTCFFDVFSLPVLIGNPKEILVRNGHAMVSRRLAEKLGGIEQCIGKTVVPESSREWHIIIDGVFETLPENCSFDFDILLSIECFGKWSLTNWLGNDRYKSYAKFRKVIDEKDINAKMRTVQEANIDIKQLEEAGVEIYYTVTSLPNLLKEDKAAQNMKNIVLFLGIALIVLSILNYLVIVVSTLVTRIKEIAVNKCYGASTANLFQMTFAESILHLSIALALGVGVLYLLREKATTLLAAQMSSLFTPRTLLLLSLICVILLTITTIVPALIFEKVPVAAAFRRQKDSKRVWKLCLLFVQFAATAVIVCLLVIVTRQYDFIANTDRGFSMERVLQCDVASVTPDVRKRLVDELKTMPEVEAVTNCYQLPFGGSGNNIFIPGESEQLFNVADMYCVTDDYFSVWEIPVIEGKIFDPQENNERNVMVNREFVRKMEVTAGWTGSIIGRQVCVTEHSERIENQFDENGNLSNAFTIIGVFEDIRLGDAGNLQLRPMTIFYDTEKSIGRAENLVIKMHDMSSENVKKVNDYLFTAVENRHFTADPLYLRIVKSLASERNIRDALVICSIVALIIALVGLLGYTTDEVNRRRREIAIRRVFGATSFRILWNLCRDITFIALPSLILGSIAAYFLSLNWLQDYTDRISLGVMSFLIPAIALYAIILICITFRSHKAVNANPVESLVMN